MEEKLKKQIKIIELSNEMFSKSKPMEGDELKALQEAISKSLKKEPTLKNRL